MAACLHNRSGMSTRPADRAEPAPSNTRKDPDDWKTGDEPMTGAQRSYLQTLSDEAGEPVDDTLTKAEASKRIDELRHRTGRGLERDQPAEGQPTSEEGNNGPVS